MLAVEFPSVVQNDDSNKDIVQPIMVMIEISFNLRKVEPIASNYNFKWINFPLLMILRYKRQR